MSEHFAVKRINSELAELQKNPSKNFLALPIETDLFDWHFTLKGPQDSVYSEGLYHGRLILPLNYPLKPPKFLMFNQSGRFEVGREICMSNTSFHPDEWQPAWTIRTILEGLISFFPEETEGAIGALRASEDTRRALATNSWHWSCPHCGKLEEIWKSHCELFQPIMAESKQDEKPIQVEEKKHEKFEKKDEKSSNLEEEKNIEGEKINIEDEKKNEEDKEKEKEEQAKAEEELKQRMNYLPNEEEVRKFIKHTDSRLRVAEFLIATIVFFAVGSQFIPNINVFM
jgi:ubiquitin-conjugating enzyme E2 J1